MGAWSRLCPSYAESCQEFRWYERISNFSILEPSFPQGDFFSDSSPCWHHAAHRPSAYIHSLDQFPRSQSKHRRIKQRLSG